MKKHVSTELTRTNIAKITDLLADTPKRAKHLSRQCSDEQLRQPPADGERSWTEVLAHLIHCEARSAELIYLALLVDEPLVMSIHPERQLGKLLQFARFPFSELLAYFSLRRTVLLSVLAGLTERQWARAIRQEGKKRQESVYWQVRTMALHEFEHLSDLENKMSKSETEG